jgi:hypothetical protein
MAEPVAAAAAILVGDLSNALDLCDSLMGKRNSRAIASHPAARQPARLIVTSVSRTASRARWSVSGVLRQ